MFQNAFHDFFEIILHILAEIIIGNHKLKIFFSTKRKSIIIKKNISKLI